MASRWNTKYYLQKAHKLGRKINYYRVNSSSKGHAAGSHRRPHGVDVAVFSLCVAEPGPVRIAPDEHLGYRWLPWKEAAEACFSWSNRDAILELPQRFARVQ